MGMLTPTPKSDFVDNFHAFILAFTPKLFFRCEHRNSTTTKIKTKTKTK